MDVPEAVDVEVREEVDVAEFVEAELVLGIEEMLEVELAAALEDDKGLAEGIDGIDDGDTELLELADEDGAVEEDAAGD